jgi:hypothetical protein
MKKVKYSEGKMSENVLSGVERDGKGLNFLKGFNVKVEAKEETVSIISIDDD